MQFGVLQFFSWSRRIPVETVYARAFDRIAIMDEGGYDAVWLAEHHFTTYSLCPSVTVMGAQVAARTQRLRLGMAVTLAAFYHPLRLAEELAMVDILSNGRLNWGAGRGFDPREFRAFGVSIEESSERFRECVAIVQAAWAHDRLSYAGNYWQFDDVEVLPRPLQQPQPPVWLAATSPDSITRAARDGYTILMDPHAAHAEIGQKRALYFEKLREYGHDAANRTLPVARLVAVAPSDAEAKEVARAGAQWTVASYAKGMQGGRDPIARYVDDVIIHGSPARVRDEIVRLQSEVGLDYLLAAPLSHESFLLFTKEVLPALL